MKTVVTILQLLCGLAIILIVLFQSGKSQGLSGAIGGVADSFLAKNKAKTIDAKLARATKWFGAVFLVLTMILLILNGNERDAWGRLFFACSAVGGGEVQQAIRVPVLPSMPSRAFSNRVMRAVRPGLDSANLTAASTFGSMEPGANCPSSI